MRVMRLSEYRPAEEFPLIADELPKPKPGPGEICLKVQVCGVCHTDLHIIEGDIHPPSPQITPGHQVVGVVESLGENVSRIKLGDRVGVPWLYNTDGVCDYCQRGIENLCSNAQFTGFHVNGGFAEFMLADADFVLPLPDEIENEQAAPLLCAGIIGYRSLKLADIDREDRIGLVGFGASAHLAIQVAKYWGCEVFVFTRSMKHRQHAWELGADWVGGVNDEVEKPLDRAIIFAPSGSLVPQVLQKLRPAGTLAINAIHMSPIPEMDYNLLYGERTLRSVANATYQDGVEFLELAAETSMKVITHIYPLEDANQALLDLKESRIDGAGVLKL